MNTHTSGSGVDRRRFIQAAFGVSVAWHAWPIADVLARQPVEATPQLIDEFNPKIGVCTSVKNSDFLKSCGVHFIEESVGRFIAPNKSEQEFEQRLTRIDADCPIRACNGFLPGSLPSVGEEANHAGVLEYVDRAFARAKRAGIETIVFGSSASRSIPEGFDRTTAERQFIALLGKMSSIAERHNIVVAIEALNRSETNFINTVDEAISIVAPVMHNHIAITADIYHMLREDEGPDAIRRAAGLIKHAHIAEREGRHPPGTNNGDFRPYLQALREIGYRGPISIECRWSNLEEQLPRAVRALKEQIADVK